MPMVNKMTKLLNKIERRLGTKMLNLPDSYAKDKWATEVIANESLDSFSRYYPKKIVYWLTPDKKKDEITWLIDEDLAESQQVLGGGDIEWHEYSKSASIFGGTGGVFLPSDVLLQSYDFEDVAMQQMMADHASVIKTGIYLDYEEPNLLRLNTTFSTANFGLTGTIPINLFVVHAPNLMTIPGTQMEIFEQLCQADVATFLYEGLKYYDNIETVFANTEMKLSDLQDKASKRDEIINKLEDSYVSMGNKAMPGIMAI